MSVYASLSISLDGYYVGANPSPKEPLGDSGSVLHSWFPHDVADRRQLTTEEILREDFDRLSALVMGRDSYEHAQAAWGTRPPFEAPIFVLTHHPRSDDVRDGTTFRFVTEGFESAVDRARDASGDADVALHGGGAIRQALTLGLLDELQIHIVPVLLHRGRQLFDQLKDKTSKFEQTRVVEGPGVTHIRYQVR